jgi:hypothetical protein
MPQLVGMNGLLKQYLKNLNKKNKSHFANSPTKTGYCI